MKCNSNNIINNYQHNLEIMSKNQFKNIKQFNNKTIKVLKIKNFYNKHNLQLINYNKLIKDLKKHLYSQVILKKNQKKFKHNKTIKNWYNLN